MSHSTFVADPARRYVLLLLTALSALSFMDRQILAVLLQPIKQEFGFSDLQIGLITGLGFAAAFGMLGIPLGRMGDRIERRGLIAWCRGIGGMVAATGALATGPLGLAASRCGAAVGDAGGGGASMSMLADLYRPSERSRVMSVFGVGGAFGAMLALLIGPLLYQWWGWRVTLALVGLAIVVFSLLLRWSVREPVRSGISPADANGRSGAAHQPAVRLIWHEPITRCLIVGSACFFIVNLAVGVWNVALLARHFQLTLGQAGGISAVAAVLSVCGSLSSGWLTDRLARRDERWQIGVPLLGVSISLVFVLGYLLLGNAAFVPALASMLLFAFFSPTWAPATYAALSLVVPPQRRATASAMVLMAGAVLGNGLGPIATGWLSDLLNAATGGQGLRYALLCMVCLLLPGLWAYVRALTHYPVALHQAQAGWPALQVPAAG
ncbi:Predicted arabinose efflux permease, MFS family [Oryzisolibacter propanilivorax]|uniref:Predicted arabinose efflux permease, MFS family n=1 Tax=Oryzisolibacter propanilivorax TaxID=1527607 RepID=A0A1G9NWQ5_9BURK|nr:MFS transporter [Oryzisolibacter propanilivorax]SDL90784.1 Predicted arabinose efflux permease, MFS family [Oryzisolibacter propanilivorax]